MHPIPAGLRCSSKEETVNAPARSLSRPEEQTPHLPRPGEVVRVRNRTGVVLQVSDFSPPGGTAADPLVHVAYSDDGVPATDRILWRLEGGTSAGAGPVLLAPTPLSPEGFSALIRTGIWASSAPYPGMSQRGTERSLLAPVFSDVRPEPHQLVPLEKAVEMPQVRLLLADDVGLGKTVEAGLIITELLVRRRIRRVLVLAPPGLREQWQRELWDRFALDFHLLDGPAVRRVRRDLGKECNPWQLHDRVIASFHFLRAEAVLTDFLASCQALDRPHAPWDLLVVDEAHHLMPRARGPESGLTRMLRQVAPWFEHRLFLTATPHDGYRSSYTGLLEMLDPLRFRQTATPTPAERRRMREVVVRRTRSALGRGRSGEGRCIRSVALRTTPPEEELFAAFAAFRRTVRAWGGGGSPAHRAGGMLVVEVLAKRLTSSLPAFSTSFLAFRLAMCDGLAPDQRGGPATPPPHPSIVGGREPAWKTIARQLGNWMATHFPAAMGRVDRIHRALVALDLADDRHSPFWPAVDGRRDAFVTWCRSVLVRPGNPSDTQQRALVFTESRTTLDYVREIVRRTLPELEAHTLAIDGTTSDAARERAVRRFNSPSGDLSLLLCTDVLAEGLNLHRRASLLFHFDVPWNPAVLEQRAGRLDRLGQRHPVTIFHFAGGRKHELRILARVGEKAAQMARDLGPGTGSLAETLPAAKAASEADLFPGRPGDCPTLPHEADLCSRSRPHPQTEAGLREARGRLALSADALVATARAALTLENAGAPCTGPSPQLLRITEEPPGLRRVLSPPAGEVHGPLRLRFRPRSLAELAVAPGDFGEIGLHAGHPFFRWVRARLLGGAQLGTQIPWTAVSVEAAAAGSPGLLIFLHEAASSLRHGSLHHAVLPLWLPLNSTPSGHLPGTLRQADPGLVMRVLQAGASAALPPLKWEALDSGLEVQLRTFEGQRRRLLEGLLERDRREATERRRVLLEERRQELECPDDSRVAEQLEALERQRRTGVLFPDIARSLDRHIEEIQVDLARREAVRTRVRRALHRDLAWTQQRLKERYQLLHPLATSVEGIAFVVPGGEP